MTTAKNLLANSGLVRTGVVADLIQATVWVFVAMTLYFGKTIHVFITIPSAIAEVWMVASLLLIGVRVRTVEPERELLRAVTLHTPTCDAG